MESSSEGTLGADGFRFAVGVVGSGKGMKPAVEKKRQTFREGGDE